MFVCHCRVVTDGEIRSAIDAGATDLCALAARCGAGVRCGGCLPAVRQILADAGYPLSGPTSARALRHLLAKRGLLAPAACDAACPLGDAAPPERTVYDREPVPAFAT